MYVQTLIFPQEIDSALVPVRGLCDGPYEDGGDGHDEAAKGGDVGEDLGGGGGTARQNALEVHLEGKQTKKKSKLCYCIPFFPS